MNLDVMFSSKTDDWATPPDFYKKLDEEFHFDLDPAADDRNHKCEKYFTVKQDGLLQDWGGVAGFLQSPIWAENWKVGGKSIPDKQGKWKSCRYAFAGQN